MYACDAEDAKRKTWKEHDANVRNLEELHTEFQERHADILQTVRSRAPQYCQPCEDEDEACTCQISENDWDADLLQKYTGACTASGGEVCSMQLTLVREVGSIAHRKVRFLENHIKFCVSLDCAKASSYPYSVGFGDEKVFVHPTSSGKGPSGETVPKLSHRQETAAKFCDEMKNKFHGFTTCSVRYMCPSGTFLPLFRFVISTITGGIFCCAVIAAFLQSDTWRRCMTRMGKLLSRGSRKKNKNKNKKK